MAKQKIQIEEGHIFSINLENDIWTFGQLCNLFTLPNSKYSQETFAFFNYKFNNEEQIGKELNKLDLGEPILIFTINGHPIKNYGLNLIGKREVEYRNIPNFKKNIDKTLGLYKDYSEDFEDILKAYFGILPWDSFSESDYIDSILIPNSKIRLDVKYMKDFSSKELEKILGHDNYALKEYLKK